ncbi:MAG: hypothetical protein WC542_12295, partial [Paludibacter sp.]
MKKNIILILFILVIFTVKSYAQADTTNQVGIVEHLGDKLPLDLKFVNEHFDTVTLKQLINKPTILSFVY